MIKIDVLLFLGMDSFNINSGDLKWFLEAKAPLILQSQLYE